MKKLILLTVLAALSGCASLDYAGTADYSVRPFVDSSGKTHCCDVRVHNGKEIGALDATIEASSDGSYTVHLVERSIRAFEGQRIAGQAADAAGDKAVAAAKVAAAVAIAPVALPAAGAALAAPGLGAAAVGAGAAIGAQKINPGADK